MRWWRCGASRAGEGLSAGLLNALSGGERRLFRTHREERSVGEPVFPNGSSSAAAGEEEYRAANRVTSLTARRDEQRHHNDAWTTRSHWRPQGDLWGLIGRPSCILPERFGLLSESPSTRGLALRSYRSQLSECNKTRFVRIRHGGIAQVSMATLFDSRREPTDAMRIRTAKLPQD
jgi:hypothetical protein